MNRREFIGASCAMMASAVLPVHDVRAASTALQGVVGVNSVHAKSGVSLALIREGIEMLKEHGSPEVFYITTHDGMVRLDDLD